MTPERYKEVGRLYQAALELEPAQRAAYLAEACGGDEDLRQEVESLLGYAARSEGLIDRRAVEVAARTMADDQTTSVIGQNFGHYRILSLLGKGGMGEVYLGEDARLGRKVAVKLLHAEFTTQPGRVRRFEREARAVSALNHPNIITIHEIGEAPEEGGNRRYIVTEYVEGETLRQRMASSSQRRIALSEAIEVAAQIAAALSAAHEAGIAHRDIKPENVMLRRDGIVKVLDFGLAKLTEPPTPELDSQDSTLIKNDTASGVVMGTPRYMSPEQARGEKVDARSDLFSLGVTLYEMIAGRAPFAGETPGEALAAILRDEPPPLTEGAPEAPQELEEIIGKALRKDRAERYQSAKKLGADLKRLQQRFEIQAELVGSGRFDTADEEEVRDSHETAALDTAPTAARTATDLAISTAENLILEVKRYKRGMVGAMAAILLGVVVFYYWRGANLQWAREQLPRIEELAQAQRFFEAYDLALQAQRYLPNDATIARLMRTVADDLSVSTEPPGAQVYLKRFAPDRSGNFPPRQLVGVTPINHLQIARGGYILYIEKEGYAELERAISGSRLRAGIFLPPIPIKERLIEAPRVPDRMAFVPGGSYRLTSWFRPTDERVRLDDFFIDKFEVTNREYKEFINAGGYLKRQFWKYPFIKEGKSLTWEEAMLTFKDRAGLPGPRNWSNQNFPEGKAEHPVTDVTWYEAAAYAAFRGKQLPTIFQWEKAARADREISGADQLMPWGFMGETVDRRANFEGQGAMPVASLEFGISPFGCYHMAGNVSEWLLNEKSGAFLTLGGSWADPAYMFGYHDSYPGFYSSNKLGFRCALNSPEANGDQGAGPIEAEVTAPVYVPASEANVKAWLNYYRYEKTPLDPQVIEVKETDDWRREKITYIGAEGERAIAYLYLPKNFPRPFQVIHYVPPGSVWRGLETLTQAVEKTQTPFIKSGRAVLSIVIKGYPERAFPAGFTMPSPAQVEFRDLVVNWFTDCRRGLDYLETRGDIDMSRTAYQAGSAGGAWLFLPAVETRYRAVVLWGAGVGKWNLQDIPEANPINFVPHIRGPKLMINGRYDEIILLKIGAEPLYKLLREPKRLAKFEGGHAPPIEVLAPTINGWLDEKLGPVKRE